MLRVFAALLRLLVAALLLLLLAALLLATLLLPALLLLTGLSALRAALLRIVHGTAATFFCHCRSPLMPTAPCKIKLSSGGRSGRRNRNNGSGTPARMSFLNTI
jgi:hypothetical protein